MVATIQKRGSWRGRFERALVNQTVGGVARLARHHPRLRALAQDVEVVSDVGYVSGAGVEHRLDIYRPLQRSGPLPVILYVHGGGFRLLSKETHWIMATILARRGYLVFSVNYRLAPQNPYPAAIEDVCRAALWVQSEAPAWGGDGRGLSLAGESAGANLVTALTVASCYQRPEPWAREVYAAELSLRTVLPACGIHQVSDMRRFQRAKPDMLPLVASRLNVVARDYLTHASLPVGRHSLADPLLILENSQPPTRALPPFLLTCGERDPIFDDTRRLAAALEALDATVEVRTYPREGHAFHAAVWRPRAQQCWRDHLTFLGTHHEPAT